jgi:hypothetical protein
MKTTTLIHEKVILTQECIRTITGSCYAKYIIGYIVGIGGVQTGYDQANSDIVDNEHTFWIVELNNWLYMERYKCNVKALLLLSSDFDIENDNYNEE